MIREEIMEAKASMDDIAGERLTGSYYNSYSQLITLVPDRPGHDRRYAIDASKIKRQLEWGPEEDFESGIIKTIKWYLEHLFIDNRR